MTFELLYWIIIALLSLLLGIELGRYINRRRGWGRRMTRRLNRTPQKTGVWMILLSPEFLRLIIYLSVMLGAVVILALSMTLPLPSIQGGI